jgi:hypothetical protein
VNNSFGVAPGAIAVSFRLEILSQVPVIVDLAVEYDPDATIFVAERLMAGLYVDDAEAAHRQSGIFLDKESVVVRPAVNDLPVHRFQSVAIYPLSPVGMKNATDSAHI